MPIIYSYPIVNVLNGTDMFVISKYPADPSVDEWETKSITAESVATYVAGKIDLNFEGDTGNAVVNLDTQSLSIEGTTNEIETVATQGNSRGILTIGLPDNVTITNDLTIGGGFVGANGAFTNDLFVSNDLTVNGATQANTLQVNSTSSMGGTLNMTLNNINNVADPVAAQDAATKSYVDGLVTGGLTFRGSFNASTGQIVSGANTGAYLYNCPGGAGARVAIAVGDYYIVANQGGNFYCSGDLLNVGDSIIAVADAIADSSTINDWSTVESDNVEGTGIANTIPIWTDSQVLGNSPIVYDPVGHDAAPTVDIVLPGQTFEFRNAGRFITGAMSAGNTFNNATLDIQGNGNGRAATFRGGVVISNNPGGVQVDNTSLVVGGGNNDNVTGSDHCLIVGNGNQITNNSDQSVAFGQGNTITGSTDALAVGNSNTVTSSRRTLSLGYNNDVNSASSFVAGGDNDVNGENTNMVLGFDHQVTNSQNFVIGNQLTSNGNKMVLGYRNQTTYPTPNEPLGLGQTKFVVATGSSTTNDSNALLITEGGRQSGGIDQVPRVILPTVTTFSASSDAAADAIGIPEGGLYQNNGVVQINRGGGSTTDPLDLGVTFDYTDSGTNLIIGENLTIATVGNVGLGDGVLQNHTGNGFNTAIGYQSLQYSIAASSLGKNTALGYRALQGVSGVTAGFNNTAVGFRAGESIENGFQNVFIGNAAGDAVTDGPLNVVIGDSAGGAITTHDSNVIIGQLAGSGLQGSRNVIIGKSAYGGVSGTGDNNIVIGTGAQPSSTSVSDEITIGAAGHNNVRLPGSLPAFADDAAAGAAGILTNMLYQTNGSGAAPLNVAGIVMIKQ